MKSSIAKQLQRSEEHYRRVVRTLALLTDVPDAVRFRHVGKRTVRKSRMRKDGTVPDVNIVSKIKDKGDWTFVSAESAISHSIMIAAARCNPKDNWNRQRGRVIALKRLARELEEEREQFDGSVPLRAYCLEGRTSWVLILPPGTKPVTGWFHAAIEFFKAADMGYPCKESDFANTEFQNSLYERNLGHHHERNLGRHQVPPGGIHMRTPWPPPWGFGW